MRRHCEAGHGGVLGFQNELEDLKMDLIASYKEPLTRVLREAILIQKMENMELVCRSVEPDSRKVKFLNSKQE